jgi:hypothetical protein
MPWLFAGMTVVAIGIILFLNLSDTTFVAETKLIGPEYYYVDPGDEKIADVADRLCNGAVKDVYTPGDVGGPYAESYVRCYSK